MENDIVIVASLGEGGEVVAGLWRVISVELDRDGALESSSVYAHTRYARERVLTMVVSRTTSVAMVDRDGLVIVPPRVVM